MTHIYDPAPRIFRHLVNDKDGFVILPTGDDDDQIYFEEWDALIAWIENLAGQIVNVDPADVESYDDWLETVGGDDA